MILYWIVSKVYSYYSCNTLSLHDIFSDQLPSHATTNPRNQGALLSQLYNVNHVHVDEEAVKTTLAILSLRSGKDLLDPYKDHPIY